MLQCVNYVLPQSKNVVKVELEPFKLAKKRSERGKKVYLYREMTFKSEKVVIAGHFRNSREK